MDPLIRTPSFQWRAPFSAMRRLGRTPWMVFSVHAACLTSLCLSFDNGSHPDEELYTAISLEMERGSDWLIPHLEGEAVFFKPPLLYVLQAASMRLIGESVLAARLPSLLASLATGWLVLHFLRRRGVGLTPALTAASFVLSSVGLLRYGTLGMMDPLFSLALLVSVLVLQMNGAWWLWSIAVAGATLLKGPIGLALGVALCLPSVFRSRWSWVGVGVAALAMGLALSLVLPWYLYAFATHGQEFVRKFLFVEHLAKITGAHTMGGDLGLLALPLAVCAPWLLLFNWRGQLRALAGALLFLGVYAVQASRQLHYGLPLVPLLMTIPRDWCHRAARLLTAVLGASAVAVLAGAATTSSEQLRSLFAVVGVGLGLVAWLIGRRSFLHASLAFGIMWALVFGAWTRVALPATWPSSIKEVAGGEAVWVEGQDVGIGRLETGANLHRGSPPSGCLALRRATGSQRPILQFLRMRTRVPASQILEVLRGETGTEALLEPWELVRTP